MNRPPKAVRGDLRAFLAWHGITTDLPRDCCVVPRHKTPNGNGYFEAKFAGCRTYIHRLALELKLRRPIASGMETRHACGNASCANPWHLEEGTSAENNADQYAHGTRVMGERHPAAKLTDEQVAQIRLMAVGATVSQSVIAAQFGICRATVSDIKRQVRRKSNTIQKKEIS